MIAKLFLSEPNHRESIRHTVRENTFLAVYTKMTTTKRLTVNVSSTFVQFFGYQVLKKKNILQTIPKIEPMFLFSFDNRYV